MNRILCFLLLLISIHFTVIRATLTEFLNEHTISDTLVDEASDGSLQGVEDALQNGAHPAHRKNLAIQLAATNEHIPIVRRLMREQRVDPSDNGNAALWWPLSDGLFESAQVLLEDDRVIQAFLRDRNQELWRKFWKIEPTRTFIKNQAKRFIEVMAKETCVQHAIPVDNFLCRWFVRAAVGSEDKSSSAVIAWENGYFDSASQHVNKMWLDLTWMLRRGLSAYRFSPDRMQNEIDQWKDQEFFDTKKS